MRADSAKRIALRRSLSFLFALTLLLFACVEATAEADNSNANANSNANVNTNRNANANTDSNSNSNKGTNSNTGAGTSSARNPVPCPSQQDFAKVLVTRAYKKTPAETTVQLGDEITVEVEQLETLLARAQCSNPTKKILLFLDGRPVKDATPFPPTDPGKKLLKFTLTRTENSRDVWTYILGESKWTPRETDVSVGLEDEYAVESTAKLNLVVISVGWFAFWAIIFGLLLIAFWLLAWKTELLRDSTTDPGGNERRPYSLARTQAAWWFFIVLASYLFIGIITGDFSTTITSTVLGLLGISAGTVVGSAFVDAGKAGAPAKNTDAPTQPAQPAQPVQPAQQADAQAQQAANAQATGQPAQPAPAQPAQTYVPKNEYWWVDILSDANGICFHRFQVAAWTLVLGIIFCIDVYKFLAMPTFNGSLLALLGISSGTYLGLKIPEATTPTRQGS